MFMPSNEVPTAGAAALGPVFWTAASVSKGFLGNVGSRFPGRRSSSGRFTQPENGFTAGTSRSAGETTAATAGETTGATAGARGVVFPAEPPAALLANER